MVVSEGTGKAAALDTYKVAGKTGTTKKQEEGGYSTSKYVASFVGYAPAANPAFAAIVVIDEPKGGAYYGGEVAAPVFKAIAEKVLRYLEVPPERQPAMELLAKIPARQAPSVTDTPVSMDRSEIDSAQLESGGTKPEIVIVNAEEPGAVMPDFRGKTLRSVMEKCAELGIELTYHGSGMAVDQSPRPGSRLAANNACKVWFARQAAGRLVTRNVPKDRVQSGKTNKAESIVVRKTIDSNRTNNSQDGTRE
jgi:membrane peptidoglycan carboxypeptidase